jgi:putative phosphoribosyl transferase
MTVAAQFQDRYDAGRFLAEKLEHHAGDSSVVVLAFAPDGVPAGYEVARALNASLDVFLVEKIFAPGYEELVVGTVASGGVTIFKNEIIRHLGISEQLIATLAQERERELQRREQNYRGILKPLPVEERNVLLVKDGLNTGANMRAAVRALRVTHPRSITVAVPVGSPDTCHQLEHEADEVVCPMTPEPFHSIGEWYSDYMQITDEEAGRLLKRASEEHHAAAANGSMRENTG